MKIYTLQNGRRVTAQDDATIERLFPGLWTFTEDVDDTPPVLQALRQSRRIRTDAFWERLTIAERADIDLATQFNPADAVAARRKAARYRVRIRDIERAGSVSLRANWLETFLADLETDGTLGAGRATVILQTPVREDEEPLS